MKTFLFSTLFAVVLFAAATSAQIPIEEAKFIQTASGQTVLLGTYTWNAELDNFPPYLKSERKTADLWWEQINKNKQQIVPRNKAIIAEVTDRNFADLTVEDLQSLTYSRSAVSNKTLVPNAVIALRTTEGNYVKLKILGYRALHDFSFKEAAILRESWKAMVLREADRPYHLEVEWVLYTKQ